MRACRGLVKKVFWPEMQDAGLAAYILQIDRLHTGTAADTVSRNHV